MKKIPLLLSLLILSVPLFAMGSGENTTTDTNFQTPISGDARILIAYFSVPEADGVDTLSSASRVSRNGTVYGNVEYIATMIESITGGDLFRIETEHTYPESHSELLSFAYSERQRNDRPRLAEHIGNIDDYDIVFVGYPNWNADLPMPLYTFFEEYDFSEKTIIPFVTHGGSSFSRTIRTIGNLEPNAHVISNGLSISRNRVSTTTEDEVRAWIESIL